MGSLNATRNKGISEGKMRKSLEKLSSGYRINRAGDDAAGLAISELMRSQIRGLNQAMRNVDDGISMTNTGEGALSEVHSMLERMKTLAVQSANSTYTTVPRDNIDLERQQLLEEIDRIGVSTDFDDIPLFGSSENAAEKIEALVPPLEADQIKGDNITLQIGHDAGEVLNVPRYYMDSKSLLLEKWTDFSTEHKANESIAIIDAAIEAVADIRAEFGAAYNHLEHTHNNLSVTSENMTSAESRIRDTDMADEFTTFTKDNIVYQAANSMVAQANAVPQSILSLLQ
ncbi:MAG: flagellin [Lachnospiraceae bacterium]|nr:flagellin [Lachnospiraceae bacterium]